MNNSPAVTPSRVLLHKRSRFNPIRQLSPDSLARQLDSFQYGDLREAALLWDIIERRDDTIKCVAAKRKAAPARLSWEILTMEESPEAERQKEVLEDFYNNLRATSAIDRNQRGGVSLLIKQMMDSVGKKYAVHNIIWKPGRDGLRAELHFVPLWFFENRSGELKYLKSETALEGDALEPGAWMVTCGEGLMEACSIAYTFKRLPYQDWLTYCERHGMPGLLGKTKAAKDSDEWRAMEEAVASISAEWAAVMSDTDSIDKLELSASGELPYPKLVERMDRAMASLWRGADLSTMSAGSGEGSGASLQGDEADLIEMDDCANISETLQEQLDRWVLKLALGVDQPLAYFQLSRPRQQNVSEEIALDSFLLANGARLGLADVMERYGRAQPEEGEELMRGPAPASPFPSPASRSQFPVSRPPFPVSRPPFPSAFNEQPGPDALIAAAVGGLQANHKDLAERLQAFLDQDGSDDPTAELNQLLDDLDALPEEDAAAADAWEKLLTAASFRGLTGVAE